MSCCHAPRQARQRGSARRGGWLVGEEARSGRTLRSLISGYLRNCRQRARPSSWQTCASAADSGAAVGQQRHWARGDTHDVCIGVALAGSRLPPRGGQQVGNGACCA